MAEHAGVVRRREDPRLVTGMGQFVDDLRVVGCLHAAMLRSPHAHARVVAIDVAAARRAYGDEHPEHLFLVHLGGHLGGRLVLLAAAAGR